VRAAISAALSPWIFPGARVGDTLQEGIVFVCRNRLHLGRP